jgi:hypothetical protein
MLKKTITYVDFDGNERTEDFYFNLTKAEVTEMEMSIDGGLTKTLQRVVAAQNPPELIKIFKEVVLKAYGEKSPDGRRFVKSQELRDGFACTQAYSELFMELATDADAAAAFMNGIAPTDPNK